MYCGTPSTPGTPTKYKSRASFIVPPLSVLNLAHIPAYGVPRKHKPGAVAGLWWCGALGLGGLAVQGDDVCPCAQPI